MKTLDELKLCKKSRKIVENWLQEWLDLFIKQANGKQGWPYRADFENDNFFFFTDCKDILEKDPEAKGQENNLAIRSRKRKVLLQLFVKTLMGKKNICDNIKCDHCGFRPCWIEALGDGNGHWTYCPKCKKLEVQVFPDGFDTCIDKIKQEINKRRNGAKLLLSPDCKKIIEEIQAYKYKPGPKKREVPKGAWSTIIKGDKRCPKCNHKMTAMPIYTGVSLEPLDGWHCPKCKYATVKK